MPRGVVIPQVREVLFDAAERVLLRDGPAGLTGRSITGEAGVATGLLYRHFADMDEFLAEFVVDRAERTVRAVSEPLARPGESTVTANLAAAVEALGARMLAMVALVRSRDSLRVRLGNDGSGSYPGKGGTSKGGRGRGSSGKGGTGEGDTGEGGTGGGADPLLARMERALAAYLRKEQKLGRIRRDVDPTGIAVALIGTAHHMAMTGRSDELGGAVEAIATALRP